MSIIGIYGRAGVGPIKTASHRIVSRSARTEFLHGGGVIDGAKSRDPGNTDSPTTLRAGLLMGRVSSRRFAPSILGILSGAVTAGASSVTVTAAAAAELVRRVGATGTFKLVGPPTANGTNAVQTITYTAVNTTTGFITASIAAAAVAGSFVSPTDGSETPVTYVPDGWGIPLGPDGVDTDFPHVPIRDEIDPANLLYWPTDTSLQAYIRAAMNAPGAGQFVFADKF